MTTVKMGGSELAGRLVGTLFLVAFGGLAIVLGGFFATRLLDAGAPWRWPPGECRVRASRVEELLFTEPPETAARESDPYRVVVDYEWQRDGATHGGSELGRGASFATLAPAQAIAAQYPVGSTVRCWIDPASGSRAVLQRPLPWAWLVLLVPLLFLGFAVAGIVGIWRSYRAGGDGGVAPLSRRAPAGGAKGCGVVLFAIFLLLGLGFLVPIFVLPVSRSLRAGWERVPANVLHSAVAAHSGKSTTYGVEVLYEYTVSDRTYRSNRYGMVSGSSSGRAGKEAIVARMPAGARVDCWVDARDPSRAVLDRSLFPWILFALLPLLFVLVGAGGIVVALRSSRSPRQATPGIAAAPAGAELSAGVRELAGPVEGPYEIEPARSRWGKLALLVFFTVVWDGVTGLFLFMMAKQGKLGSDGCATLFMVPFTLVGLFLLASVPYQLLALANPRPLVRVSRLLRTGSTATIEWRMRGAGHRIRHLRVVVEGREEATYRRGTDSTTDTHVFATFELADTEDPLQIVTGGAELRLPLETMHSFAAPRNKVTWVLKMHGDIPRWPDLDDEAELTVLPAEARS
jgi:hypothetical protein